MWNIFKLNYNKKKWQRYVEEHIYIQFCVDCIHNFEYISHSVLSVCVCVCCDMHKQPFKQANISRNWVFLGSPGDVTD